MYDATGSADQQQYAGGPNGGHPFSNAEEMFEHLFGNFRGRQQQQQQRTRDVHTTVRLSFAEAVSGASRTATFELPFRCEPCKGSGSRTGSTSTCPACKGLGVVRKRQQQKKGRRRRRKKREKEKKERKWGA
jgi:molecular chaperone DnaJ